ncbi:sugar transporter ERD6-like 5 isoform X2 [Vigna angularis]|uniref:sugar transporter ERD6-like 5 isoform X2 n=1 Tax=Phaseolus angularis TaxID=3914 RepID=UPI000809FBF9|nr:sugar transporter ERD6-like 5 isoform X2 [Vigna angularis]
MGIKGSEGSLNSTPLLSSSKDGVDFHADEKSEASEMTFMLVFTAVSATIGSYVFGYALGYSSPAQYGIVHDLHLSVAEYSTFGSILTIGAIVGATLSGRIADYVGRRLAMGFSEVFCILGSVIIAFSKVSWWLYIGRMLVGCGVGIISYVVPVYIAEITPKDLRGAFTEGHLLMTCCGLSLTYLIGAFLNWRILALIGTVPCIVHLLTLPFIPDSPRWLAKVGRLKESESALQRLRGKHADVYQEATEIREYTEALQQHTEKGNILVLFKLQYLRTLTVGVGLMMLQQFGGISGILFYTNSIFISAGFSDTIGTIAVGVFKVSFSFLGVLLMDRCGRRPLLLASATGACVGSFLTALSFFLKEWKSISPFIALVGVLVYMGLFSLGMSGIPSVIMSEIFPINVKGTAGSLVILVNWTCSLIVAYTFNFLMSWSSSGTFFLFSGICASTVVFVAKLVPETKGRTLEEIQASLNTF